MISLNKILSEIKLINQNFPKNISWIYKVNNQEEAKFLIKNLNRLGYTWSNKKKIDFDDKNGEITKANFIWKSKEYPLYIFWKVGGTSITWSDYIEKNDRGNYKFLNFKDE